MAALQAGEVAMTARNWPTLFYEDGVYDPTEKTRGLFKNHIVVRVCFFLFTVLNSSHFILSSTNTCLLGRRPSPVTRQTFTTQQSHPKIEPGV